MALIPLFGSRFRSVQDTTDDFNADLEMPVRQLLQLTNSPYELERAAKLGLYWRYFRNDQYEPDFLKATYDSSLGTYTSASTELGADLQVRKQLWNGVRPLFSIINYAVQKDRELTFKKARPLPVRNDVALEARLTSKWERQRFYRTIKLSPLFGAVMGDSFLRMIPGALDGNPSALSRLAVYSPENMVVLRDQHQHNRIIAAKIEYYYTEAANSADPRRDIAGTLLNYESIQTNNALGNRANEERHVYTMIITEEAYYTFRDHKLYAFNTDLGNSWANNLGFVPVVQVPFNDINEDMGLPTFYGVIPALDAVNELNSMAGQILKNSADAPIIAYGVSKGTKFEKTLNSSGQTVWNIPFVIDFTGHQHQPHLEFLELKAGSLASMLDFVARIQKDVEAALPEMQLKSATQRTGSGYEAQVEKQGIIDKIEAIRETQFDATEDILQMALVADDVAGDELAQGEGLERLEEARSKYDLTIWAESVLPKSRAEESQIESVSLADGVITMRDARLQRGLSFSQVLEVEKQEEVEFNQMLERERKWLELHAEFGIATPPPMPKNAGNGNVIGNAAGNIRATKPTSAGQPGGNAGITSGNRTQGQPMTAPNGSAKNIK